MADFQVKSAIFNALGRSPPPLQAHSQRPFDVGMAEFISNSAMPSEGSIRTSWPALRNDTCANHSGYQ